MDENFSETENTPIISTSRCCPELVVASSVMHIIVKNTLDDGFSLFVKTLEPFLDVSKGLV